MENGKEEPRNLLLYKNKLIRDVYVSVFVDNGVYLWPIESANPFYVDVYSSTKCCEWRDEWLSTSQRQAWHY